MPLNQVAPDFALLSSLDMRTYSATTIFTRGSTTVSMPTFSAGEGVYEDLLFFLNGRYSSDTLNADAQLADYADFGTGWTMAINSDDKITIQSDTEFDIISQGTLDFLGFGSSTVASSLVGSVYVATAPNDWTRGLIDLTQVNYRITETGGSGGFNIPAIKQDLQDVTVWLRSSTTSDSDSFGLSSLESLDNTALSSETITWTLTDEGFVQCHYTNTQGDISWNSTEIRDLLGFTGDEDPVVDGAESRLTASKHSKTVLFPTRPIQSQHSNVENVAQFRRFIGGGYASNFVGSYVTTLLNFDLDAQLDSKDDYRHFANQFARFISPGERINFYQCWGDSRRSLRDDQITSSQSAYDLLFTSEVNGERGRLRASCLTPSFDLNYPVRLHRRVPVTLELEHL